MKTNKFRVWDSKMNSFWYGNVRELFGHVPNDIPDEHIQQYTGFSDIKGILVYEGDIVSYEAGEPNRDDGEFFKNKAEVKFENGAFWPRPIKEECEDSFYDFELKNIKVIGNIFENPELLK